MSNGFLLKAGKDLTDKEKRERFEKQQKTSGIPSSEADKRRALDAFIAKEMKNLKEATKDLPANSPKIKELQRQMRERVDVYKKKNF